MAISLLLGNATYGLNFGADAWKNVLNELQKKQLM